MQYNHDRQYVYNGIVECLYLTGFFYFQLANLPPWIRAKINDVMLVAIVHKSLINKYSMQAVLKPIIEDIKKLVSHTLAVYIINCIN